ncbi:MAG: transporter associated domain-containing protein [Xanthomonadaceae bacterium]|jgi:magnesium and cobalt transporter|nr:transporter associated domain-containing protein [Xanthomonadaceae bacterium]
MADDNSSKPPGERRSWLDRLGQLFSGEPKNREDIIEILRAAREAGVLEAETLSMLEGAMAVSEGQVADVMVPRSQMVVLDAEAPLSEILAIVIESGHSRFPVHGEERNDILGILLAKDLLPGIASGQPPDSIRSLLRKPVFIPESKRLNVLLREFRLSRNHMAVVVDEYGGVAGLVTIEDVLEQIVGEIDDEHDEAEDTSGQIAEQADGSFVIDALTPIEDFNERFESDFPDDDYDTLGGLVTAAIGHLPEIGEELTLGRFLIRVARADRRRVQAFEVRLLADVDEA